MQKELLRSAWVEINLAALTHNIKQINYKVGDKKIIGVVKADAYGHGATAVADTLKDNGINSFAVATLPEAVELRQHFDSNRDYFDDVYYDIDGNEIELDGGEALLGAAQEEILVLGLVPDIFADTVVEYDLTPVVCDLTNAKAFSDAATALGKEVSVLIALDTGMGRIGYVIPDGNCTEKIADDINKLYTSEKGLTNSQSTVIATILEEVRAISELPNINIAGVISHLSTADETDKTFSLAQEARYAAFCKALKESDIKLGKSDSGVGCNCDGKAFFTLANSAGIMESTLENTHYDAVRPGIIMYGCYPSDKVDKSLIDLKPVMSVKANIVHLKDVPAGFSVGYGRKYISEKPAKIATLGLGYADGYPRRYSTQAESAPHVIVNGVYAPLAGKICMDQFMIDVTDVPDVKVGDEVIIMGTDGNLSVTADEIASSIGTINYEVLCNFAMRLPRVYKYFK